jgi:hypothetical protein
MRTRRPGGRACGLENACKERESHTSRHARADFGPALNRSKMGAQISRAGIFYIISAEYTAKTGGGRARRS